MNEIIINSLHGYIETLYIINKRLLKLYNNNSHIRYEENVKELLELIKEIPRIVPYSFNKETQSLELKKENGLLEFNDKISYLCEDYTFILKNHYKILNSIRKIRNKYEHAMHNVESDFLLNSSKSFQYSFTVKSDNIDVCSETLIPLIKDLNILFSKIVCDAKEWAEKNGKTEYLFYKKMLCFNFANFNKLY